MYRLTLNPFATKLFNTRAVHIGNGMTPVIEEALGRANYNKYIFAQDPLARGSRIGVVRILLDSRYRIIGTIERLVAAPGLNLDFLHKAIGRKTDGTWRFA